MCTIARTLDAVSDAFRLLSIGQQDAFIAKVAKPVIDSLSKSQDDLAELARKFNLLKIGHDRLREKIKSLKSENGALLSQNAELLGRSEGKRGPYKPEQNARIRELFDKENKKPRQIAAIMSLPLETVKKSLDRSKKPKKK